MPDTTTLPHAGQFGIQESVEAAVGAKLLVKALRQAFADDSLGFEDLGYFMAAQNAVIEGIRNAKDAKAEVSDLQREEAVALSGYLYDFLFEFVELVEVIGRRNSR